MLDINAEFYRMIAEMRQFGEMPAPGNVLRQNSLLRYREAREKILDRFLAAFAEGYRLGKEDTNVGGKDNNAPTNEPLTPEELCEGYDSPVWLSWYGDVQEWAFIRPYSKTHLEVLVFDGEADLIRIDEYRRSWVAYRRPPEPPKED